MKGYLRGKEATKRQREGQGAATVQRRKRGGGLEGEPPTDQEDGWGGPARVVRYHNRVRGANISYFLTLEVSQGKNDTLKEKTLGGESKISRNTTGGIVDTNRIGRGRERA